jgi:ribosome-binding ATPase YchF (GTP1/OBG family)
VKIGIIGNPQVGKTTLFKLLTKIDGSGNMNQKANIGIAKVPDSRIDFLSGIFQPKKTTYATIELVDMAGTAQRPDGKKTNC